MKNVLISNPSTWEGDTVATLSDLTYAAPTYKCYNYLVNEKKIIIDKVYLMFTSEKLSSPEKIHNFEQSFLNISSNKVEIEIIILKNDVNEGFDVLSKLVLNGYNDEFIDLDKNEVHYYFNSMGGLPNFKKFIYPITYFNDNTTLIEKDYDPSCNKVTDLKENRPKNSNVIINYEECMINDPRHYKDYLNEFYNDCFSKNPLIRIKNEMEIKDFKNINNFIYNRSKKMTDGSGYKLIDKTKSIEKSIRLYNYLFAYDMLEKFSSDSKLTKKVKRLYYDSISAYSIEDSYYDGYLCFSTLLKKKQPILAINETENLINKDLYELPKIGFTTIIIESMESFLCNNKIFIDYINGIDDLDSIVEKEFDVKHQDKDLEKHGEVFYKEYLSSTKSLITNFDKFKCAMDILKNRCKKINTREKNKNGKIQIIQKKKKDWVSIRPNTTLFKKIIVYETYKLIFTYKYSVKVNGKKYEKNYYMKNFYLNIIDDFKRYDSLNLFDLILNNDVIYKDKINELLSNNNIDVDIDNYVIELIMKSDEEAIKKVYNKLIELIYFVKEFENIRNQYTHELAQPNIFLIKNQTRHFLKDMGKLKTIEGENIKEDESSLYEYLRILDSKLFKFFVVGNKPCIDYENDLIIEKLHSKDILKNIDDNLIIKDSEYDEDKSCLVSIFTDKEPNYNGVYSPTLSILNHLKYDKNKIDDIYYIVTNNYLNDDKNKFNEDIKKHVEDDIHNIDGNINVIWANETDYIEDKQADVSYDFDSCFKKSMKFFSTIKFDYSHIYINTTSGLPSFKTALGLLRFIDSKVECYDCEQDNQYYKQLYEFGIIPENKNKKTPNSQIFQPKIYNDDSTYSFVNTLQMIENDIKKYNFNSLYFNLKDNDIISPGCKKASENLYNWINGDFTTLVDHGERLNNEPVLNILTNITFFAKRDNYELAAISSGYVIEKIVDYCLEYCKKQRYLPIEYSHVNICYQLQKIKYQNIFDDLITIYEKYRPKLKKTIPPTCSSNRGNVQIDFSNQWPFILIYIKSLNKNDKLLKGLNDEDFINIVNLFEVRNTLIHKNNDIKAYYGHVDKHYIQKGLESINKFMNVINKTDKLKRISTMYETELKYIKRQIEGDLDE